MLVAAGLVWINSQPRMSDLSIKYSEMITEIALSEGSNLLPTKIAVFDYGWPMRAVLSGGLKGEWDFELVGMNINIACALAILAATAFACEWFIRRRERKQQKTPL